MTYNPYYPPPPPPPRKPVWPWIVGGSILGVLALMGGCFALVGMGANHASRDVEIVYEVTGDIPAALVTWSSGGGQGGGHGSGTQVPLPWSHSEKVAGPFRAVNVFASTPVGAGGGTLTCRIKADGKVITEQTGSGPFTTVSCYGTPN